ncbi:MAG: TIGR03905 family TSCPD domain-containing protein [Oscillospiraceae bacterium]|jgi:uncharacterized protein (TIGR03905 family)|nr:TIGR03905 family TSCPD domain-containing protein [Oscillospiraceae bacterium]
MKTSYVPRGVCATRIDIDVQDGIVRSVRFYDGCPGNLLGVTRLVEGLEIDAAIEKLRGIDCRGRGTSCPDQLARALESSRERGL